MAAAASPESLPARLRASFGVLRQIPGQRRALFAGFERLAEARDARVREFVRFAAETVPFYRDHFRAEGIDPGEIRTADDLSRLPLIGRDAVQSGTGRFRSTSPAAADVVAFTTSGSTGAPVVVFHDRKSLLANMAYGERERLVVARLTGRGIRARTLQIGWYGIGVSDRVRASNRRSTVIPGERRVSVPMSEPFARVVERMNDLRPDVLVGTGSYLEGFFRRAVARGTAGLHLPRLVLYVADAMTRAGKELIEETLGIPVISRYSATEAFKIGLTCEERAGFHLHDDLCHVRVIGADGRDLPRGRAGEVVISNLVNRGTVLLNYRTGDVATLGEPGCACGRTTSMLAEVHGRVKNFIQLAGGGVLDEGALAYVVSRPEVISFQLAQLEPERFELRLVVADETAFPRVADAVVRDVRELVGSLVSLEPVRVDELLPGPRGKARRFVPFDADEGRGG